MTMNTQAGETLTGHVGGAQPDGLFTTLTKAGKLNTGLVAVPNRMVGGFDVYMTGGSYDPRVWMRGRLNGDSYFESKNALVEVATCASFGLRRHADYLQLVAVER